MKKSTLRKTMAMSLTGAMMLSLVACGSTNETTSTDATVQEKTEETVASAQTTEKTKETVEEKK